MKFGNGRRASPEGEVFVFVPEEAVSGQGMRDGGNWKVCLSSKNGWFPPASECPQTFFWAISGDNAPIVVDSLHIAHTLGFTCAWFLDSELRDKHGWSCETDEGA